jgi:hypothetical protein
MKPTEPDPVATMREFREYLALTYEARHLLAATHRDYGAHVGLFSGFLRKANRHFITDRKGRLILYPFG